MKETYQKELEFLEGQVQAYISPAYVPTMEVLIAKLKILDLKIKISML